MNTVVFVNATIGCSENLILVIVFGKLCYYSCVLQCTCQFVCASMSVFL